MKNSLLLTRVAGLFIAGALLAGCYAPIADQKGYINLGIQSVALGPAGTTEVIVLVVNSGFQASLAEMLNLVSKSKQFGGLSQTDKDRLKTLAGEWRGTMGQRGKGEETTVTYRLIANNSALAETLFPGTPHEMITVYHLDSDKLLLTHYCTAGNQPTLALTKKSTAATRHCRALDGQRPAGCRLRYSRTRRFCQ